MKAKIIYSALIICTLFSCKNELDKSNDPIIETSEAKSVAANTCYTKATIVEKGSYEMIDYGFVYSTSIGSFGIENGTKVSLKADALNDNTFETSFQFGNGYYNPSQVYYVRAYLVNKKGIVYGLPLSFRGLMLTMASVQPTSGKSGDRITITGENFSSTLKDNVVKFNTTVAKVIEASSSRLVVEIPANITYEYYDSTVKIYVTVGGATLSANFTVLPVFTGFSPTSGTFGTMITISGADINSSGLTVKCGDLTSSIFSPTSKSMLINVPGNIAVAKFSIKVIKNGVETVLPGEFTMNPVNISFVSPIIGFPGSIMTITGTNLNPANGSNQVKIGGVSTATGYVNQNSISVTVPSSLTPGLKSVELSNGITNVIYPNAFTVVVPKVTGSTPSSGYYGNEVIISGENLSGNLAVYIGNNGCELTVVNASTLKVKVPHSTAPGTSKIRLSLNNAVVYEADFIVLPPVITGFSPESGTPGTEVTINGNGFGNYGTVRFGTVFTSVLSCSPAQMKVVVPSNAGDGAMKISVIVGASTTISSTDFTIKK